MHTNGATSVNLPKLTGVPRAASVDYCKQLIIEPTFCGSRFSTGRLLAVKTLPFTATKKVTIFLIKH